MSETLLVAKGVCKSYVMGSEQIPVLRDLNLALEEGEVVSVVGASGVGKSTLLHILGLLDTPDQGHVYYKGEDLFELPASERAGRRNAAFGFIFQFYHLIPELTAVENVLLPSMIAHGVNSWRSSRRELKARALEILCDLGLEDRLRHRPSQLSGGERQRVAIGRALVNSPDILLCDEPTGNLDPETSVGVREALWGLKERHGQAMLLVTHDVGLAERGDRVLRMQDGQLVDVSERPVDLPLAD